MLTLVSLTLIEYGDFHSTTRLEFPCRGNKSVSPPAELLTMIRRSDFSPLFSASFEFTYELSSEDVQVVVHMQQRLVQGRPEEAALTDPTLSASADIHLESRAQGINVCISLSGKELTIHANGQPHPIELGSDRYPLMAKFLPWATALASRWIPAEIQSSLVAGPAIIDASP